MFDLPPAERDIVSLATEFVNAKVKGRIRDLEKADVYPEELINEMKQLGFFGLRVPEKYGGTPVSTLCFAMVNEELARGWMSLAGAVGSHSVIAYCVATYGTEDQRERMLPLMATGEGRGAMALTEPSGGSDLQAIRTFAVREGNGYVINGNKTFITNARKARFLTAMVKTDRTAKPAHKGISLLVCEPGPGLTVSKNLSKLGYKGVETCELIFDNYRTHERNLVGGAEGVGFAQMMDGLEIGRIQVAARALGVAKAALEDATRYAQVRSTFGKPIWRHQAVGQMLADMVTKLEAARLLTYNAAALKDTNKRVDMESGMAKYFASEVAAEIALNAIRIHGGYGYTTEYEVERYYRDAPLMIVGEGTNEVLKNVISRKLIERSPVR